MGEALLDSDNTTAPEALLSYEAFKSLGFDTSDLVKSSVSSFGTAASGQRVKVIGQMMAQRMYISFDNRVPGVEIRPCIVQGLSHSLNLGASFLHEFKCLMDFSNRTVTSKVLDFNLSFLRGEMKNCNNWTKELIQNVNDHPFCQTIQRPWSTKDWDVGIQSIMHFSGKKDVDEITLHAPENTILDAKNEISPGTFVFEHSVPSKWLGKKFILGPWMGRCRPGGWGFYHPWI